MGEFRNPWEEISKLERDLSWWKRYSLYQTTIYVVVVVVLLTTLVVQR